MRELENVIFSRGRFTKDEHGVEFVDKIENGVKGQYVVLVSREDQDGASYRSLFAQIHFVAMAGDRYLAMAIPVVESFDDNTDSEDGEAYNLRQELKPDVETLAAYALTNGRRAEFDSPLPLADESWDEFRTWVGRLRRDQHRAA